MLDKKENENNLSNKIKRNLMKKIKVDSIWI